MTARATQGIRPAERHRVTSCERSDPFPGRAWTRDGPPLLGGPAWPRDKRTSAAALGGRRATRPPAGHGPRKLAARSPRARSTATAPELRRTASETEKSGNFPKIQSSRIVRTLGMTFTPPRRSRRRASSLAEAGPEGQEHSRERRADQRITIDEGVRRWRNSELPCSSVSWTRRFLR